MFKHILLLFVLTLSFTAGANFDKTLIVVKLNSESGPEKSGVNDLIALDFPVVSVSTDSVTGLVDSYRADRLEEAIKDRGFDILHSEPIAPGRVPVVDPAYHNYEDVYKELTTLAEENPNLIKLHVIGKTVEGRDIVALQFNTTEEDREAGKSEKPGYFMVGAHHARELLSVELPLMFAQWLAENKNDSKISDLLNLRDVWIVPMLNPDGVVFDRSGRRYKMWRKNRSINRDGSRGVDLNRNYSFKWNQGGSSSNPRSDIFHGPRPFSEPETQAVKKFMEERSNINLVLSVHTFSELILYPWGYTKDKVEDKVDRNVFEKMAKRMSEWNGYKPIQSSDLYIASGVTSDWMYGERGVFSFTFELFPSSQWSGGFYPKSSAIQPTFEANRPACEYMLEMAGDPRSMVK